MKSVQILLLSLACAAVAGGCSKSSDSPPPSPSPRAIEKGTEPNPSATVTTTAANPATTSSSDSKTVLTEPDRIFFTQAGQAGYFEIEASKMAQTQAADAAVKAFANTMVGDHTAAAAELKQLAAQKNMKVADDAGVDQRTLDELKKLNGAAFDKTYAQKVGVNAHVEAVKLFEQTSHAASDPDVKAFAAKTLPTLQHHLEMAKALPNAKVAGTPVH